MTAPFSTAIEILRNNQRAAQWTTGPAPTSAQQAQADRAAKSHANNVAALKECVNDLDAETGPAVLSAIIRDRTDWDVAKLRTFAQEVDRYVDRLEADPDRLRRMEGAL